jgi:hypothetical protein
MDSSVTKPAIIVAAVGAVAAATAFLAQRQRRVTAAYSEHNDGKVGLYMIVLAC